MKENSKVCTIYLVRHGETDYNTQKRLQGHIDIPLNAAGKHQAAELAMRLQGIHFNAIYSSDLMRARETAETVAQARNLEVRISKILRERHFGEAEGRSLTEDAELKQLLDTFFSSSSDEQWHARPIAGWETNGELVGRTFSYLRGLALAHVGQNVLIVTHGSVIITLLAHLGYITWAQVGFGRLGNGAFAELQSDGIDFTVKRTEGLTIKNP